MNPELQRNAFFVKEHVGLFKAANNYDILDPQTGRVVLECREDHKNGESTVGQVDRLPVDETPSGVGA